MLNESRAQLAAIVAVVAIIAGPVVASLAWAARTPAMIEMKRPKNPEMEAVVFPHWKHQKSYQCYTCHPPLFSRAKPAVFGHDAMAKGKFCGACHDGKVAFLVSDEESDCEVCHVE